jgi:hypothetical protein
MNNSKNAQHFSLSGMGHGAKDFSHIQSGEKFYKHFSLPFSVDFVVGFHQILLL